VKSSGDTARALKVIVLWVALAACLCAAACGGLYALAAYRLSDL
jgi:hypothetical protein